jgi:hypothetical protein
MVGATNNIGFRGAIASGSNRWNLYMDGTAANFLAGGAIFNNAIGLGSAASPSYGSAGQVLTSSGPGAVPTWSTVTGGGGGGSSNTAIEGGFPDSSYAAITPIDGGTP